MCKINGNSNINIELISTLDSVTLSDCNAQNCLVLNIILTLPSIKNLTIINNHFITEMPAINGQYDLTISNCNNLVEIININSVDNLTIKNCPCLKILKFINISHDLIIDSCKHLTVKYGYVAFNININNSDDIVFNSSFNGSVQLIIADSSNVFLPSDVWIQDLSIKNSNNIIFNALA